MYIAYMHVYILCVIDVFSAVFGVIIGDHDSNSYHAQADCGHAFWVSSLHYVIALTTVVFRPIGIILIHLNWPSKRAKSNIPTYLVPTLASWLRLRAAWL